MLALHDYFLDKYHHADVDVIGTAATNSPTSEAPPLSAITADDLAENWVVARTKGGEDRWALQYLSVLRVQPILEAFDDDGTGFVSIMEANALTLSKPREWRRVFSFLIWLYSVSFLDFSLPHWLAYWAAGTSTIHLRSSPY